MGLFPENTNVYPPKVGETKVVQLVGEIKRVKNPGGGKDNYSDKNHNDLGYYDLIPVLIDGVEEEMKMATWKLYFALRDSGVDEGDVIEITHPSSGIYTVTKK